MRSQCSTSASRPPASRPSWSLFHTCCIPSSPRKCWPRQLQPPTSNPSRPLQNHRRVLHNSLNSARERLTQRSASSSSAGGARALSDSDSTLGTLPTVMKAKNKFKQAIVGKGTSTGIELGSSTASPLHGDEPSEWVEAYDKTAGRPYWYNSRAGTTSWDNPLTNPRCVLLGNRYVL